ncbi:MAG: 3-phosphoglycerate dehydrogenase [Bacilli bacterium]|nr:3-phosphoglycerate dehydrogenase [Bacilli bacterium]
MKAYCLDKISKVALATLKDGDKTVESLNEADSILVRSSKMHEMALPENILAVARAGAGVNNIPLQDYAEKGVVVFNTPGANANAVKELVIASLLLASRDIIGGNLWVKENAGDENIAKSAEKAKSKFAGNEVFHKSIAVLGLGAIGVLVANACVDLGMQVIGYDPYLSIHNAMLLNKRVTYVSSLEEAVKDVDFLTVHIPLTDSTKGLIGKELINKMKDGATILNLSCDGIIDEEALKKALEEGKIKKYITDFANPNVVKMSNTMCFPHLGASTEEAEDNCALMAISELKDYLENGNISNSVNYPAADAGKKGQGVRICINHRNIPGMINHFTTIISRDGGNIASLVNKSRNEYAYTIIDADKEVDMKELLDVPGVLRVRVIA